MTRFEFQPEWKELLYCRCSEGSLILEFTMGQPVVYLPDADTWNRIAPDWAIELWQVLHEELRAWCDSQDFQLLIAADATVE